MQNSTYFDHHVARTIANTDCPFLSRLIASKQIELIYTADGKEYLTPQQLQREIRDELYVSKGRASLVDLAAALNVDFAHVEAQGRKERERRGSGRNRSLGSSRHIDGFGWLCICWKRSFTFVAL